MHVIVHPSMLFRPVLSVLLHAWPSLQVGLEACGMHHNRPLPVRGEVGCGTLSMAMIWD